LKRRFVFEAKGKTYKLKADVPSEELAQEAELTLNLMIEKYGEKAKGPDELWLGIALALAIELAKTKASYENLLREIESFDEE